MKVVTGLLALSVAAGVVLVGCYPPDMEPLGGPELKEKTAQVVATYEQLVKAAEVSVYAVRIVNGPDHGFLRVELAIQNKGAAPVRLTDLTGSALLVDDEGFASSLDVRQPDNSDDFTVAAYAKQKLRLTFAVDPARARALRLYGHDFPLPAGKPAAEAGAGH